MTGLLVTADTSGNVVVHITVTCPAEDAVHVEPLAGGLVLFEIGADEPVQVRITTPAGALVDVLWEALAAAMAYVDGVAP